MQADQLPQTQFIEQIGTHLSAMQLSPELHVPQDPVHPSLPQFLPAQLGTHWQVPQSSGHDVHVSPVSQPLTPQTGCNAPDNEYAVLLSCLLFVTQR
jgi:hypothetical protein